ncbi:MAG: sensor histidine kinase [Sphingobium sp.]|uniref:sensor histidine kinase n=1 Tax=Sphingobium sp. TaxID=1912891 RepID=UPI0029BDF7BC|nr:sensor histidine kinase [Sphingobium sp.]MDX3911072.1 sensor histidine kinase [Sphingobium sp.]
MNDSASDAAVSPGIGHAIVRSDPWTFESADSQTRSLFNLPDGEIMGLPLFLPEYAKAEGEAAETIDVMVAGAADEDKAIRAKLLPLEGTSGLYSAVFFHPETRPSAASIFAAQQDLQHRISNCLAVIRSIFRRTAQASDDTDTLVSHFLGRLDAFSRIQSNVVLYDTYGVALDELILDEFMVHATRTGDRLSIEGPSIRIRTRAAETLSLAIHELATNSVKYGALGSEMGHIAVRWRQMQDGAGQEVLSIEWIESGVALVDQVPAHRGFGTDLIENSLAFELGAQTSVHFDSDGLRLLATIPITSQLLHPYDDDTAEALS